jgi:hypothetical protein
MTYSGLWNGHYNENYALIAQTRIKGEEFRKLTTPFARRIYSHGALGEIIATLVGAAAGEAASLTHKRVTARQNLSQNVQGGLVAIETFSDVARVTTADDATAIIAALQQQSTPTYVVDRSGNGSTGRSKLGY